MNPYDLQQDERRSKRARGEKKREAVRLSTILQDCSLKVSGSFGYFNARKGEENTQERPEC